jgi:uncharacterized membrane protein YeaQ/YmgE (transglycosylase-associated protein family)
LTLSVVYTSVYCRAAEEFVMVNLLPIIIQLITGAIGGNLADSVLKSSSLGTLWNSVAGIIGGAAGGQLMGLLGLAAGSA